jgi:hypothetical protein
LRCRRAQTLVSSLAPPHKAAASSARCRPQWSGLHRSGFVVLPPVARQLMHRGLTLRCSRLATAGFASLRERLSSNVRRLRNHGLVHPLSVHRWPSFARFARSRRCCWCRCAQPMRRSRRQCIKVGVGAERATGNKRWPVPRSWRTADGRASIAATGARGRRMQAEQANNRSLICPHPRSRLTLRCT